MTESSIGKQFFEYCPKCKSGDTALDKKDNKWHCFECNNYWDNNIKLSDEEVNQLHDEVLERVVRLTNNFIDTGIKSMHWKLTNGFSVSFTDRKKRSKVNV